MDILTCVALNGGLMPTNAWGWLFYAKLAVSHCNEGMRQQIVAPQSDSASVLTHKPDLKAVWNMASEVIVHESANVAVPLATHRDLRDKRATRLAE